MRKSSFFTLAAATLAVPALWLGTVAVPAVAGTASPAAARAARTITTPWECRTGTAPVTPDLTATSTVCGRREGSTWRGKATVTLTTRGRAAVSGDVVLAPNHWPVVPETHLTDARFTARRGHPATVKLTGSTPIVGTDTGLVWTVSPYVTYGPGSALSWEAVTGAPAVALVAHTAAKPLASTRTTPWTCQQEKINDGSAKLCIRQKGGYVESTGTLTYSGQAIQPLFQGIAIDGANAVETRPVLAAGGTRTIALATTRARLTTRDDTAQVFLTLAGMTIRSAPIAVG